MLGWSNCAGFPFVKCFVVNSDVLIMVICFSLEIYQFFNWPRNNYKTELEDYLVSDFFEPKSVDPNIDYICEYINPRYIRPNIEEKK